MAILKRFRRQKIGDEAARRSSLLTSGRLVDGMIIDANHSPDGGITHVFYSYHINGVEYESSQLLDEDQQRRHIEYSPGALVRVRYDPRRPVNSVVV
jgi:hypothetical protein